MYAQFAKHGTEWRPIWVSCGNIDPHTCATTTTTSGPTTTTTVAPTTTTTVAPTTTTTVAPTTTTTTAAPSTQSCTGQYDGFSWSYFSGGSCGSCDCSTNFNTTLTNLYNANAGTSPLGGATITTTMSCTDCDVPSFGEGHTYVSHT